jgi:hypothetical protein
MTYLIVNSLKNVISYPSYVGAMDKSNFVQYIKESDNDKNSNQVARVEYHSRHLLTE